MSGLLVLGQVHGIIERSSDGQHVVLGHLHRRTSCTPSEMGRNALRLQASELEDLAEQDLFGKGVVEQEDPLRDESQQAGLLPRQQAVQQGARRVVRQGEQADACGQEASSTGGRRGGGGTVLRVSSRFNWCSNSGCGCRLSG
jgi:hypothetical protein